MRHDTRRKRWLPRRRRDRKPKLVPKPPWKPKPEDDPRVPTPRGLSDLVLRAVVRVLADLAQAIHRHEPRR